MIFVLYKGTKNAPMYFIINKQDGSIVKEIEIPFKNKVSTAKEFIIQKLVEYFLVTYSTNQLSDILTILSLQNHRPILYLLIFLTAE